MKAIGVNEMADSSAVVSAFAPGRVEILGNHTDYNSGYVLAAAIDLGTTARGWLLDAAELRLHSDSMPGDLCIGFTDGEPIAPRSGKEAWANYPLGVFEQLRTEGFPALGAEVRFSSTLPIGAGLSSSAALTVSFATLLVELAGAGPRGMELAKLCRRADNEFVGVQCGLLDQATSVFGQRDALVFLDCGEERATSIALPAGLALVVADTGAPHRLTGGEYNERFRDCMAAARALGVESLREANQAMLDSAAAHMDPTVWARARHIVGENARVLRGRELLSAGDSQGFGELMFESHRSSRQYFDNSTPELDLLVELAANEPAVLGARLSGGGFGGAIVALVGLEDAGQVADRLATAYQERSGNPGTAFVAGIGAGAAIVNS